MSMTLSGNGTITGLVSGGLPDGTVLPADLSTGSPSWDSSGNISFNSGYGSVATAYGCRAWVNFNGTGSTSTNQTVRGSSNVSSVYKTATGSYSINFANAMPDANYAVVATNKYYGSGYAGSLCYTNNASYPPTTGAVGVVNYLQTGGAGGGYDVDLLAVAIFR